MRRLEEELVPVSVRIQIGRGPGAKTLECEARIAPNPFRYAHHPLTLAKGSAASITEQIDDALTQGILVFMHELNAERVG